MGDITNRLHAFPGLVKPFPDPLRIMGQQRRRSAEPNRRFLAYKSISGGGPPGTIFTNIIPNRTNCHSTPLDQAIETMNANQISKYAFECTAIRPVVERLASLELEKSLFVIVSLLDLLMTSLLLRTGSFIESNPFAGFFYEGWGMLGMTGFKMILVGMILLVVNIIGIWRLPTARGLLVMGSISTGGIVIYSGWLLGGYYGLFPVG